MILHNSIRVAQNLSRRNSHAQIKLGDMPSLNNRVRLTYGHRNPLNQIDYNEPLELAGNKHEQYSGSVQNNVKRGSEVATNNVESCEDNQPSLRGEVQRLCGSLRPAQNLQVTKSHPQNSSGVAQNGPVIIVAVNYKAFFVQKPTYEIFVGHSITGSNPVQLSDSDLDFLRCRRLISPCIAELINCPVLSPGFFTDSMPSMISCAIRAVTDCDFAFFEPVAMSTFSQVECKTLYTKNYCLEVLTCKTPVVYCVSYTLLELRCGNSEARQCANTNRASYHNVTEAYIMACIQHTQTRPKYQYRFLALSAIGRNVIHITATTEREAREQSPAGCVMVFAGRLPVREGRHA